MLYKIRRRQAANLTNVCAHGALTIRLLRVRQASGNNNLTNRNCLSGTFPHYFASRPPPEHVYVVGVACFLLSMYRNINIR